MITVEALSEAFRARTTTPAEHLEKVFSAARDAAAKTPAHAVFCALDEVRARRDAAAATERHARGAPLGPLDGVPLGVKDEVDAQGLPTRAGTVYLPAVPVPRDATVVARLRAAGAVIVGKTVQHELGLGATGITPHGTKTPRNPHDPGRAPGGSSSGSAVAAALGILGTTVSTDGGGSVRIPAALCGLWGLKATWGRISNAGDANLQGTVGHIGPIATSVAGMEWFYRAVAGADDRDPITAGAPSVDTAALDHARAGGVQGLRLGIDEREWADADPEVARVAREAVRALESDGARVVGVSVPMARHAVAMGYVTMISEAASGHASDWLLHRDAMGLDVRLAVALGARIRATEYHHAQKLRLRLRRQMATLLSTVDLWVTPTTACTAPPVRPGAESTGESDQLTTNRIVRYTFLGNLTGLPAASAPAGTDGAALPVGLQLMGRAWDEATVLRACWALERSGAAKPPRPRVHYDLLGG